MFDAIISSMRVLIAATLFTLVMLGSRAAAQNAPNPGTQHTYWVYVPAQYTPSEPAYDQTRDWFDQNVRLADALIKQGYDVNYTWGMNRHGQAMGGAILTEMMRWLWRNHPVSTDPLNTVERSPNGAAAGR